MSTRTAAAPPWGALLVDFPPLHGSSGSGCPKRTVQRPSSTSPFFSVCVSEGERERKLPFVHARTVPSHSLSTGCWFRRGIAAFVMLTKTREETMRKHSDLMQIAGCDSCASQCPFLEGRQLFLQNVFTNFCAIRDLLCKLCASLDQLFKVYAERRSRLRHVSARYAAIWRVLIERRRGVCRPSAGSLSSADTSELFLRPELRFLLFLSRSLSERELLPAEAAPHLACLPLLVIAKPNLFQKILNKHFPRFLIWIDGFKKRELRDTANTGKEKGTHEKQIHVI